MTSKSTFEQRASIEDSCMSEFGTDCLVGFLVHNHKEILLEVTANTPFATLKSMKMTFRLKPWSKDIKEAKLIQKESVEFFELTVPELIRYRMRKGAESLAAEGMSNDEIKEIIEVEHGLPTAEFWASLPEHKPSNLFTPKSRGKII